MVYLEKKDKNNVQCHFTLGTFDLSNWKETAESIKIFNPIVQSAFMMSNLIQL